MNDKIQWSAVKSRFDNLLFNDRKNNMCVNMILHYYEFIIATEIKHGQCFAF